MTLSTTKLITRNFQRNNLRVRIFHRSSHLAMRPPELADGCATQPAASINWNAPNTQPSTSAAPSVLSTSAFRNITAAPAALFNIRVLAREHDCTSLRIWETLLTKRLQPSINSRQERQEFTGLLFRLLTLPYFNFTVPLYPFFFSTFFTCFRPFPLSVIPSLRSF